MISPSSPQVSLRPLLSTLAVDRLAGEPIPGRYCAEHRLWVVEIDGEPQPLIDVASGLAELTTKTKVELESDDEACFASSLELATKTLTQTEQDDVSAWAGALLALVTKTAVNQEEDKQDLDAFGSVLLEVSTKTSISDPERDDQGKHLPGLLEAAPLH